MKKTLLLTLLAVLAIACTKEPAAPEGDRAVFSASFAEDPVVKTTLEGTKVLWAASDEISILWEGGSTVAQAASAGETTTFSATVGAADTYYAVYPSSVTAALSGSDLSLTVPAAQHGTFGEANIAVARTVDRTFSFKNLCALGKFTLTRSDIAEVRFAGNGEDVICGAAAVALDGSGIPSCSGAAGKEIVLTPASGDAFTAGTYYFAVIPGTLEGGVRFTLTTSGGDTLPAKSSTKSASFIRSKMLNFGTIDAAAPLELFFDFTVSGLDWPTSKSISWGTLKNCDSGLALDNGEATDNPHRRAQVTYTLDGVGYDFTFADPDNATAHNIYLDPTTPNSKGVYSGSLRYFGLPAIEGKKLVKVVMVQNASTKTTAGWYRNVGITKKVYTTSDAVADFEYVTGGEPQNQNTNGATYTYELSGTALNTVYWLSSSTNASIIKSLRLFYADADGSEPGSGDDPGEDPGPETLNLHFDFTGEPLEGWPTSDNWKTTGPGNLTCVYPLDGTNYSFILTECGNASAARVAWVKDKGGLILYASWRYLGLPAIDGYKLVKVSGNLCLANNSKRKAGISKSVVENNTTGTNEFVTGGDPIGWTTQGTTYAYNLSGTEANTVYYLTCTSTSIGTSVLDLTYEKVD